MDFRGGTTSSIKNSTIDNNAVNQAGWWGQNTAFLLSGPDTTVTMENLTVNNQGSGKAPA